MTRDPEDPRAHTLAPIAGHRVQGEDERFLERFFPIRRRPEEARAEASERFAVLACQGFERAPIVTLADEPFDVRIHTYPSWS